MVSKFNTLLILKVNPNSMYLSKTLKIKDLSFSAQSLLKYQFVKDMKLSPKFRKMIFY